MMKLAFIVPSSYILKVDKYCDFHLVLAHLLKNPLYLKAIQGSKKYKILDNGAFENGVPVTHKKLIETAQLIKADEIICPDVFYNLKETTKLVDSFIEYLDKNKLNGVYKLMGALQGSSYNEIMECYFKYVGMKEIDVIGIGYTAIKNLNLSSELSLNRLQFIKWLKDKDVIYKPLHLLGLGNNGGVELFNYNYYNFVRSNDSSALYTLSRDGQFMINGYFNRPKEPINFEDKYKEDVFVNLECNIKKLKILLSEL